MSRREQITHQRVVHQHQVVVSTSPEVIHYGEQLPTYITRTVQPIQYTARHYYREHSNQSHSPVIRVATERFGQNNTPFNLKQGQVIENQDLQKTQNAKRVYRSNEHENEQKQIVNQSQSSAANILKRYSTEADSKANDINNSAVHQKHSVETIDILNKKYQLGLENTNLATEAKKKQPTYGYDSGMTLPHNYNVGLEFNHEKSSTANKVVKPNQNVDQFDGNSNDIESENFENEQNSQKPVYQKQLKYIQRRETVDSPDTYVDDTDHKMQQSNSDKNLGVLSLKNVEGKKNGPSSKFLVGERDRQSKQNTVKDKNQLSVIGSEKHPSRDGANENDKISMSYRQNSPSVNEQYRRKNTSPSIQGFKETNFDDRITLASAREADFYFEKYDSIPINDYLKYIGPIKGGKFHGLGRIMTNKGEMVYEGEFYQGKYDGKGKLWNFLKKSRPKQIPISAEIVANYMTLATTNYLKDLGGDRGLLNVNFSEENWEVYRGYFKEGKKHGCGKLKLTDGRVYEGEFVNGLANGYGMLHYFDKSLAGRWQDNILEQFL